MLELGETYSSGTYLITDVLGAPGAATFTVSVIRPDGTLDSPTPANPVLGSYTFDYPTVSLGPHSFVATATGGVLGTIVRKFSGTFVVSSATSTAIVGLDEVKDHLNIPRSSTDSDSELELMIAASTSKIEERCGPVRVRTVTNERQRHDRSRAIWLREPPGPHGQPAIVVTSATNVRDSTTITPSTLSVDPTGRVEMVDGGYLTSGTYLWTYTTGRTLVPSGLRLAALNFVRDSWTTQRGASGLPWQGGMDEAQAIPGMGLVMWRLEQDIHPYRLPPAGA